MLEIAKRKKAMDDEWNAAKIALDEECRILQAKRSALEALQASSLSLALKPGTSNLKPENMKPENLQTENLQTETRSPKPETRKKGGPVPLPG